MLIAGSLRWTATVFILVLISFSLSAQKEGYIWYFGYNAGLDFNYGSPPKVLTDGQVHAYEGCATISTKFGKLLFYTDGITVWDRTHQAMPNGKGLLGNNSSTQSGIIVPYPGNANLYFLFA